MNVWYFAYGSNLNKEQMKRRVGKWKDSTRAVLRDHKVVFDTYSQTWRGGVADIVESPRDAVHGAAYLLTEEQVRELDKYEGVPKLYSRRRVTVEVDDMSLDAITYVASNPGKFIKPSQKYLDSVTSGLRQHGYEEEIAKPVVRAAEGNQDASHQNRSS